MFADHQAKVFQRYRQLKAEGPLSTNLKVPAPAKLRNECERIIGKRFSKDDKEILSSFFGEQADLAGYVKAINNFDIDLFRPLEYFMKGKVKKPDPKHVELLAWLIDYSPRPYRVDYLYHVSGANDTDGEIIEVPKVEKPSVPTANLPVEILPGPPSTVKKSSVVVRAGVILTLLSALGFITFSLIGIGERREPGKCMLWTGDHYEKIACDTKPADTTAMVIGLDSNKLVHFKRITRADTLTVTSVGKVWYIKINDDIEYYTSPGEPPAHPGRRLLPLTAHILDVHPRHPG
jgi:hypothetical protein